MNRDDKIIHIIQTYLYNEKGKIKKGGLFKQGFSKYREEYEEFFTPQNLFDFLVKVNKLYLLPVPEDHQHKSVCKKCGQKTTFRCFSRGYKLYCSRKCSSNAASTYIKKQQTCIERYGIPLMLHSNKGKINQKQTLIENKENIIIKRKETCLEKYGNENFNNHEKIKKTNLKKYGFELVLDMDRGNNSKKRVDTMNIKDGEGNTTFQKIKKNRLEDIVNGKNHYARAAEKAKITRYKKGEWVKPEDKEGYKAYSQAVWLWTRQNDLSNLPYFDKRGNTNKGGYHLDHIFSILEGYNQNIPSFIVGSKFNLRFIKGSYNQSKRSKCDISKEELIELFFNNS